MEHLIEFVVADHEAVKIVNSERFRACFKFVQPNLKESEIPKRDALRKAIIEKVELVVQCLRQELAVSVSRFAESVQS
jgi:hypothetical protein